MRQTIEAELKPWFKKRTLKEIGQALDEKGVCWGQYQSVRQGLKDDPDLSIQNPMFEEIYQPGIGKHLAAGPSAEFSAFPRPPVDPAPILGQDTHAVLSELLGLSKKEIDDLQKNGII